MAPYRANSHFVEQFSTILADLPRTDGSKQYPEVWYWKGQADERQRSWSRVFISSFYELEIISMAPRVSWNLRSVGQYAYGKFRPKRKSGGRTGS
jgi:hypothetical protein